MDISSSVQIDVSRVRYKVKHKKRYSISTNNRVLFFLVYKHTDNDVYDDILKNSDPFLKISKI